jgi:colanic acid/amylovoran biosynthesis glycosyltransferase
MSGRLRALHLFNRYLGMTENWAFHLLDGLQETDVVVASKEFARCNFYPEKFQYLEAPVKKMEHNQQHPLVRLFNAAVDRWSRCYPWYVSKTAGSIDLMHSHFAVVGWEYRWLARRLDIPHVVSFYGLDYEQIPYLAPVWRERYQVLFSEADLFLCEGSNGVEILAGMGCPAGKIRVARLGVEVDKIATCRRTKQPRELKLLQVARMVEKKGHLYTVKAFVSALKDCPDMTLTLVGDDRAGIRPELDRIIREAGAEGKIVFIERIDFSRLHEFMEDFHVFIHPSCYSSDRDCEGGAPVVLLDAQATGMPIISTTHCDIPDEVVHGRTGLLCPEKDVTALSDAIGTFYLMAQEEFDRFAAQGRAHVAANYDSARSSADLEQIYRDLVAGYRSGKGR